YIDMNSLTQNSDSVIRGRKGSIERRVVSIAAPSLQLFNKIKELIPVLESFKIPYEISIVAAHRAPNKTLRYIDDLEKKGIEVVIACGNGSAHLPGMIASLTNIPVIGIPLESSFLGGLDSLVSIVQMPKGVPVATVGMGSSYNAAILAGQILSLKYPFLRDRIKVHKKELEISVETEDNSIRGQTFHT
ncbi:MAG: 5-(carboxyamino)imidazole ribonucleotide mutase, partial [Nitrososphaeraceae archaeon]